MKTELPLHNAIKRYADKAPARFHMPGHKGFLNAFDVTELDGTDDLSRPKEAIARLEARCAEVFSARDSILSVNGSTACNIAMLLSLGQNKKVLTARNCHKSVVNGLALAGHSAYLITPDENGVITPGDVDAALDETECCAVMITSPTYRGFVCDIAGIAEAAHRHGALLFVDCAHGAHFAFSNLLPEVPKEADMWCVSCHKTLDALNQAAVLNIGRGCPLDKEEVRRAMFTVHTTSPSYPIMLSIESAIASADGWDWHCARIENFVRRLEEIEGVRVLRPEGVFGIDPTRLNIAVDNASGYEVEAALIGADVYPEMSDSELATLITSPRDRDEWYDMLCDALAAFAEKARGRVGVNTCAEHVRISKGFSPVPCDVRGAVFGKKTAVPLEEAEGFVCAEAAGIYPPGSAILFPGETISREAVSIFAKELEASLTDPSFGLHDGKVMVSCGKDSGEE